MMSPLQSLSLLTLSNSAFISCKNSRVKLLSGSLFNSRTKEKQSLLASQHSQVMTWLWNDWATFPLQKNITIIHTNNARANIVEEYSCTYNNEQIRRVVGTCESLIRVGQWKAVDIYPPLFTSPSGDSCILSNMWGLLWSKGLWYFFFVSLTHAHIRMLFIQGRGGDYGCTLTHTYGWRNNWKAFKDRGRNETL